MTDNTTTEGGKDNSADTPKDDQDELETGVAMGKTDADNDDKKE